MIRRILCSTDFSATAGNALRAAAQLAKALDAELVVLHARYVPTSVYVGTFVLPEEILASVDEDADRGLTAAVDEAIRVGAPRVERRLVQGVPWAAIVDALEEGGFDLCVIGTEGRTGISRFLLGSVAAKVIRHAPVSVLAIRPATVLDHIKHALCPTDFSSSADHAIEVARELVQAGGTITLLHVIDLVLATPGEIHPRVADLLDTHVTGALAQRAAEIGGGPHTIRTSSRVGAPGSQILAAVDDDPTVDLVVMGSRGRTGLARIALGSVAEMLARHARCPVLVARSSVAAG